MKYKEKLLINEIKDIVYFLSTHNKNYTKEQYFKIIDLQEKIESLEDLKKE